MNGMQRMKELAKRGKPGEAGPSVRIEGPQGLVYMAKTTRGPDGKFRLTPEMQAMHDAMLERRSRKP